MKDIAWINTVKALCIIGVFFVHSQMYYGCWQQNLNQFILPFYVNGFLFISGYLLFWKQLSKPRIDEDKRQYISRVGGGGRLLFNNVLFRIVIPSIIFATIEFFPSALIQGHDMSLGFCLYKTIGGGTYWFTSTLIVAELALLVAFCTRNTNIWCYVIFCMVVAFIARYVLKYNEAYEPWAWNRGLMALAFLALGGLYWKYERKIDVLMKWWFTIPLVIVYAFLVSRLVGLNNPLISMHSIQPLGFVSSTVSCLLLVWVAKKIPGQRGLLYMGRNTLGLYFMSGALPIILGILSRRLVEGIHLWTMLMIFIMSLIIAMVAVSVINRWMPWLWDLRKIK